MAVTQSLSHLPTVLMSDGATPYLEMLGGTPHGGVPLEALGAVMVRGGRCCTILLDERMVSFHHTGRGPEVLRPSNVDKLFGGGHRHSRDRCVHFADALLQQRVLLLQLLELSTYDAIAAGAVHCRLYRSLIPCLDIPAQRYAVID